MQFIPLELIVSLTGLNSLAPGRFGWHFRKVIFKPISVIDGWSISCKIALKWFPLDLTYDKSTLFREWLITWANIDPDLCRNMSPGHNQLIYRYKCIATLLAMIVKYRGNSHCYSAIIMQFRYYNAIIFLFQVLVWALSSVFCPTITWVTGRPRNISHPPCSSSFYYHRSYLSLAITYIR